MNIDSIIKTIDVFMPDDKLAEVRCFAPKSKSGYFKDKSNMIKHLQKHKGDTWYFAMNEIDKACYSREQHEKILIADKQTKTTSDKDVTFIDWILIDVDPVRAVGTSSTDEEKEKSKQVILKIFKFLHNIGFSKPISADSGNGYHLLYKVAFNASPENTETVKHFLQLIDMYFSDGEASVDVSVHNPARITKLYGTKAQKGSDTKERPHRYSEIIKVPTEIKLTSIELVKKVAAMLPKPEQTPKHRNFGNYKSFDLRKFISDYGISVQKEMKWRDGTKFILDYCLFDPSHKAPDAAIIERNDGTICYHCFHNSCSDKSWRDVRLFFEPNAYDYLNHSDNNNFGDNKREKPKPPIKSPFQQAIEENQDKPKPEKPSEKPFICISEIKSRDRSEIVTMQSGFRVVDKKMGGFNKGEMSVWSGFSAAGKSSVLSQLALETVNNGFNVALFSGELTPDRVKKWLHLQAAGRQHTTPSTYNESFWVKSDKAELIDKWLSGKMWLYNNLKGFSVEKVLAEFARLVKEKGIDTIIIDNLMMLDIKGLGNNKFDNQSILANHLAQFVKEHNVHVHFICHPRKPNGFLRKYDISGSGDITNAADNVMLVHRVNNDFKRSATEFFEKGKAERYFDFDNVLEIAKNRDLGIDDELIGLFFEKESKRFLNERHENKVFGWESKWIIDDLDKLGI